MKYFKPEEFNCGCGHCGLGFNDCDPVMLQMLDDAREQAGTPFKINSAVRCDMHNASPSVNGSPTSSHLNGSAVDIHCTEYPKRYKIIDGLLLAGFTRIGIAKNFIHADTDQDKSKRVIWLYS